MPKVRAMCQQNMFLQCEYILANELSLLANTMSQYHILKMDEETHICYLYMK